MANQQPVHIFALHDDRGTRELVLDSSTYSIGRDPKCTIRLVSQFVSRLHATLVQMWHDDGTFYYRIIDGKPRGKQSANGLVINGQKVVAYDLQNGDEVIFGPHVTAIYRCLEKMQVKQTADDDVPSNETAIYTRQ